MISCKEYVEIKKKELKEKVGTFKRRPKLCVVQIGNDPASNSYIKGKKKDCEEIGIIFNHLHIENYEEVSQPVLMEMIELIDADPTTDGIIIQLPIPDKYNIKELQQCISPEKDVDGFRKDSYFKPCTPKGIIDWLKYNKYDFVGKNAVVVGRSEIVGKPLVNMSIDEGATVTCCNSHSDVMFYTQYADIVFSAIGKPKYFDHKWFDLSCPPKIIVDIGINRDENGKLCGDINKFDLEVYFGDETNVYITSVPGGVGLLTRETLMDNVICAYEMHMKGSK